MKDPAPVRDFGLIQRVREEEERLRAPLEWSLIRRLLGYAQPVARKRNLLFLLTAVRSAQLPALVWGGAAIISGPIAHRDIGVLSWAIFAYGVLAILTDGMFHFRQRYALEVGETVVNGLRAELFAKTMRQPMSFFHRVKI